MASWRSLGSHLGQAWGLSETALSSFPGADPARPAGGEFPQGHNGEGRQTSGSRKPVPVSPHRALPQGADQQGRTTDWKISEFVASPNDLLRPLPILKCRALQPKASPLMSKM